MPVSELILWQNVPAGSHADVGVAPTGQPIVSDGEHTLGAARLEQADDLQLRPGPHTFQEFTQPGDHNVDIRTVNQGTAPIVVTVTATLFDGRGNTLAGPEQRPRSVPPDDHYLVTIMIAVLGDRPTAGAGPAPALATKSGSRPAPKKQPAKKAPKKAKPKKKSAAKTAAPKKSKRPKRGK